jgi:hypothetical protein
MVGWWGAGFDLLAFKQLHVGFLRSPKPTLRGHLRIKFDRMGVAPYWTAMMIYFRSATVCQATPGCSETSRTPMMLAPSVRFCQTVGQRTDSEEVGVSVGTALGSGTVGQELMV